VASAEPGAPFEAPAVVPGPQPILGFDGSGDPLRLASNARGDTLLVWPSGRAEPMPGTSQSRGVAHLVGVYRPAGGSFGAPEVVEGDGHILYRWDVALGETGDALVAWSTGTWVFMGYRPAGGLGLHDPAVSFDAAGNGMVAYVASEDFKPRIEIVRRARGGSWAAPQGIDAGDSAHMPDIAAGADGRALVAWSPQARNQQSARHRELGIYASVYDPSLPPAVTAVRLRRGRLGVDVTESGRATLAFKRRSGRRFRRVAAKRIAVVPGYNRLKLPRAQRRKLARRGRYVAEVRMVNADGKRSRLKRKAFKRLR
jgi:hypothetical protein